MSYEHDEALLKEKIDRLEKDLAKMRDDFNKEISELKETTSDLQTDSVALWKSIFTNIQNVTLDMKSLSVKMTIITTLAVTVLTTALAGLANMFMK